MKRAEKKNLPAPVVFLAIFYLINALLFLLTTLMFYEYLDILSCGKVIREPLAIIIKFVLILLPVYLAARFYALRKDAYFSAIAYQVFFTLNAFLTLAALNKKSGALKPLLEISLKPEYKIMRVQDFMGPSPHVYLIQILSICISVFIIAYMASEIKKAN